MISGRGLVLVLLAALPAATRAASDDFKALDVAVLQADSQRYHRMARNLRNRYQLRAQKVSALDTQVKQTIAEAQQRQAEQLEATRQQQAQAQSNAAGMSAAADILGFLPGGGGLRSVIKTGVQAGLRGAAQSGVAAADQRAANAAGESATDVQHAEAAANDLKAQSSKEQAKLEILSNRADQLDRLADAKGLLASAEEMRLKAEELSRSANRPAELEKRRDVLETMDAW